MTRGRALSTFFGFMLHLVFLSVVLNPPSIRNRDGELALEPDITVSHFRLIPQ